MEFKHISVLFEESIKALNIKSDGIYVDGTLGGGGHSEGILSSNEGCRLIGIDQDSEAIAAATKRLSKFDNRLTVVKSNFCRIKEILKELDIDGIDGAVLDLGVSSYQLDNAERGFSYMQSAPLDMRMDTSKDFSAYDVINSYGEGDLARIFYEYGEEKWSRRIAEFIVKKRAEKNIETTAELVDIIKAAIPKAARMEGGHPAKRVFQAVRIEVNNELGILKDAIEDFAESLKSGGRLAIITFHSLEDRIVKQTFMSLAQGCECPKSFPICVCNKQSKVKILTRKPLLPSQHEEEVNPRSKSAKLRVIEKL